MIARLGILFLLIACVACQPITSIRASSPGSLRELAKLMSEDKNSAIYYMGRKGGLDYFWTDWNGKTKILTLEAEDSIVKNIKLYSEKRGDWFRCGANSKAKWLP